MSGSSLISLRLDHLAKASQSLALKSPAVSGHLRSAQARLATGEDRPLSSPTHPRICSACGSSLIPGWNCDFSADKSTRKKRTRQDRLNQMSNAQAVTVRCSRCDSVNTIGDIKTPAKSVKTSVVQRQKLEHSLPKKIEATKPSAPPQMNVTSLLASEDSHTVPVTKKRTRNKKTSLQSMLDSRKPAPQTKGFGLGLADFMTG